MVLIGFVSFLEPHRSSKRCAPSHKSVPWNILDTLPPIDFWRISNVHSISGTSCSFLIWSFTFTVATAAAFRRGRNSFAFTSSWFSFSSFNVFRTHRNSSGHKCWTAQVLNSTVPPPAFIKFWNCEVQRLLEGGAN